MVNSTSTWITTDRIDSAVDRDLYGAVVMGARALEQWTGILKAESIHLLWTPENV